MAGMSQLAALNVVDYATLTVSSTAVSLADASPAYANGKVNGKTVRRAFFTVETDAVRWRSDGTAPTTTEGHVMAVNTSLSFTGANYRQLLKDIQFIRVTSDAALKITYFD